MKKGGSFTYRFVAKDPDTQWMHLNGHHAVVPSRNGVAAGGSPWIVDSLNGEDGQTYVLAFVADNPGIWMPQPAARDQGLVTHLMYAGWRRRSKSAGTRTTIRSSECRRLAMLDG